MAERMIGVHCPVCSRHLANERITDHLMAAGPYYCPAHGPYMLARDDDGALVIKPVREEESNEQSSPSGETYGAGGVDPGAAGAGADDAGEVAAHRGEHPRRAGRSTQRGHILELPASGAAGVELHPDALREDR